MIYLRVANPRIEVPVGRVTLTPEIRGFAGTEFCGYGYRYHLKYPGIYPCHSLGLVQDRSYYRTQQH